VQFINLEENSWTIRGSTFFKYLVRRNDFFIQHAPFDLRKKVFFFSIPLGALAAVLNIALTQYSLIGITLTFILISVLDIVGASLAIVSYISVLVLAGKAITLASVISAFSLPIGVLFALHIGELCWVLIGREAWVRKLNHALQQILSKIVIFLFASITSYTFVILQQSLEGKVASKDFSLRIVISLLVGTSTFLRTEITAYLGRKARERGAVLVETYEIRKPFGTNASWFVAFISSITIYIWTQSIQPALLGGAMTLIVLLLLASESRPSRFKFKLVERFHSKNILVEILAISLLVLVVTRILETRPLVTFDKAIWLIYLGFIPGLLHISLGHFYDDPVSQEEGNK